jgi:hypothetical protein
MAKKGKTSQKARFRKTMKKCKGKKGAKFKCKGKKGAKFKSCVKRGLKK